MTWVYIVLGLIALVAICVFVIWIQGKRIKEYRTVNEHLGRANHEAALRLEHIREYIAKNKIVMEEAEHERRELWETPDSDLVNRANSLFGGVREPSGGNGNGTA